jgi:hypothetical protein
MAASLLCSFARKNEQKRSSFLIAQGKINQPNLTRTTRALPATLLPLLSLLFLVRFFPALLLLLSFAFFLLSSSCFFLFAFFLLSSCCFCLCASSWRR